MIAAPRSCGAQGSSGMGGTLLLAISGSCTVVLHNSSTDEAFSVRRSWFQFRPRARRPETHTPPGNRPRARARRSTASVRGGTDAIFGLAVPSETPRTHLS
jgi:hypothetical protein